MVTAGENWAVSYFDVGHDEDNLENSELWWWQGDGNGIQRACPLCPDTTHYRIGVGAVGDDRSLAWGRVDHATQTVSYALPHGRGEVWHKRAVELLLRRTFKGYDILGFGTQFH